MLTYQKNTVRTWVRKLVEFLLRTGDISTGSSLTADVEAMQKEVVSTEKNSRAQKVSYQSEVPLKMCSPQEEYMLVLEGRADGIDTIEENGEKITLIDENQRGLSGCKSEGRSRSSSFGAGQMLCLHVWKREGHNRSSCADHVL